MNNVNKQNEQENEKNHLYENTKSVVLGIKRISNKTELYDDIIEDPLYYNYKLQKQNVTGQGRARNGTTTSSISSSR
eukprot:Pgem_evm1s9783